MSTLSANEKVNRLGVMGEKYLRNLLSKKGYKIEDTTSVWDNEKDFLIDGKTCEVKTQHLVHKFNIFTVTFSNLKKVEKVDYLFFVELPHQSNNWKLLVWLAPSIENRNFKKWRAIDNILRYAINARDCQLMSIIDLSEKELNEFIELNTSQAYNFHRSERAKSHLKFEIMRLNDKLSRKSTE